MSKLPFSSHTIRALLELKPGAERNKALLKEANYAIETHLKYRESMRKRSRRWDARRKKQRRYQARQNAMHQKLKVTANQERLVARDKDINERIVELIAEKKITITAALMKSITDPEQKRKIIEATCLSKV